jgi:CRP/FNR family transcriptional regulator, nitrogen fixation regulation protein
MQNARVDATANRSAPPSLLRTPTTISADLLHGSTSPAGIAKTFARNEEIFGETDSADYFYKVLTGAVRTYKVLVDGRRQIGAFYLPGEVFGLELGQQHSFSAEAVVATKLTLFKTSSIVSLAASEMGVARELWTLTAHELRRAQEHVLLLSKSAAERVATFLLEMTRGGPSDTEVELPMSRQDVADYLGLTIETVSRMLTRLEKASAIRLPSSKRIVLSNRAALKRLLA